MKMTKLEKAVVVVSIMVILIKVFAWSWVASTLLDIKGTYAQSEQAQ